MPSPNASNGFRGSGTSTTVIGFSALIPNELPHRARWTLALILPLVAMLEWAFAVAHAASSPEPAPPPTEASLP
jgi:hypothetical protein